MCIYCFLKKGKNHFYTYYCLSLTKILTYKSVYYALCNFFFENITVVQNVKAKYFKNIIDISKNVIIILKLSILHFRIEIAFQKYNYI